MKMLAATVALATLITAPALAQTWGQRGGYGYGYDRSSYGLGFYAYAPAQSYAYAYVSRSAPGQAYAYAPGQAFAYAPGQAFAYAPGRIRTGRAARAFANQPMTPLRRGYGVFDTSGNYIGYDPDPIVRDQLARDPAQGE